MESNLKEIPLREQQLAQPYQQDFLNEPKLQDGPIFMPPSSENIPPYIRGNTPRKSNGIVNSPLGALISIAILIIFIFFGDRIFSIFHIAYVYHFIVSVFIIIILYLIILFIPSFFITYPKDLLTLLIDRLKQDQE